MRSRLRNERPPEPFSNHIAIAIVLAIVGGTAALAGEMADIPAIAGSGLLCVLVAVVAAAYLSWHAARRSGRSLLNSLWSGVRTAFGWLIGFLP